MKPIWYCTFFNLSIRYLWCSCLGGKSNINCLSNSTSEKSGSNFWVHPLNHAELLFLRLLHADWDPVILLTAHCDPITPTCTLGPHYSHLHTGTLDFYLHTGGPFICVPAHRDPMILLPAHWDHIILPPAHWDPITPTCTLGPPTSTYTLGVPSYAYLYIGTPWYSHLQAGSHDTDTCTLGPHYSHLLHAHWGPFICLPADWDPITPTCTLGCLTFTCTLGPLHMPACTLGTYDSPTCTLGPHYPYLHTGTSLLPPAHWDLWLLPVQWDPFICLSAHWDWWFSLLYTGAPLLLPTHWDPWYS